MAVCAMSVEFACQVHKQRGSRGCRTRDGTGRTATGRGASVWLWGVGMRVLHARDGSEQFGSGTQEYTANFGILVEIPLLLP